MAPDYRLGEGGSKRSPKFTAGQWFFQGQLECFSPPPPLPPIAPPTKRRPLPRAHPVSDRLLGLKHDARTLGSENASPSAPSKPPAPPVKLPRVALGVRSNINSAPDTLKQDPARAAYERSPAEGVQNASPTETAASRLGRASAKPQPAGRKVAKAKEEESPWQPKAPPKNCPTEPEDPGHARVQAAVRSLISEANKNDRNDDSPTPVKQPRRSPVPKSPPARGTGKDKKKNMSDELKVEELVVSGPLAPTEVEDYKAANSDASTMSPHTPIAPSQIAVHPLPPDIHAAESEQVDENAAESPPEEVLCEIEPGLSTTRAESLASPREDAESIIEESFCSESQAETSQEASHSAERSADAVEVNAGNQLAAVDENAATEAAMEAVATEADYDCESFAEEEDDDDEPSQQPTPAHENDEGPKTSDDVLVGLSPSASKGQFTRSSTAKSISASNLPKHWEWPTWCLQLKKPCIEVYVEDQDDSSWVAGHPQSRLTDENGNDSFVCVEYIWCGDKYQEEFEPHQVRAPGSSETVADIILAAGAAQNDDDDADNDVNEEVELPDEVLRDVDNPPDTVEESMDGIDDVGPSSPLAAQTGRTVLENSRFKIEMTDAAEVSDKEDIAAPHDETDLKAETAKLSEDKAATQVQAHWRGKIARSVYKGAEKRYVAMSGKEAADTGDETKQKAKTDGLTEDAAATQVQACWRGKLARQVYSKAAAHDETVTDQQVLRRKVHDLKTQEVTYANRLAECRRLSYGLGAEDLSSLTTREAKMKALQEALNSADEAIRQQESMNSDDEDEIYSEDQAEGEPQDTVSRAAKARASTEDLKVAVKQAEEAIASMESMDRKAEDDTARGAEATDKTQDMGLSVPLAPEEELCRQPSREEKKKAVQDALARAEEAIAKQEAVENDGEDESLLEDDAEQEEVEVPSVPIPEDLVRQPTREEKMKALQDALARADEAITKQESIESDAEDEISLEDHAQEEPEEMDPAIPAMPEDLCRQPTREEKMKALQVALARADEAITKQESVESDGEDEIPLDEEVEDEAEDLADLELGEPSAAESKPIAAVAEDGAADDDDEYAEDYVDESFEEYAAEDFADESEIEDESAES